MQTSQLPDLIQSLNKALGDPDGGQNLARIDLPTRLLYSTDASIYQHEPMGVVFPRTTDDLQAIVETCSAYRTPLLARGSGSSLGGQAIGPAMIVDCTRYLNRIIEIDPQAGRAIVEPGVILNSLNRQAARFDLQFGPDPASAERASMGGCVANNATGAHSIRYGMAADHLLAAQVVLADGSLARFEEVMIEEAERIAGYEARGRNFGVENPNNGSGITKLYREALEIRQQYGDEIRQRWPRTWRCASGYTLNYLLPWSASQPSQWNVNGNNGQVAYPPPGPGRINLAHLLAGSEGTLAVFQRLTVRLVKLPRNSLLATLVFPSLAEACDAVPQVLEQEPSAVELIPFSLVNLARSSPSYAQQLTVLGPLLSLGEATPNGALLVVEMTGDDADQVRLTAEHLEARIGVPTWIVESPAAQRQIWAVRKVGLGLILSRPGDSKPWSFIEDLAVPVDRLGHFVRSMEQILAEYGKTAEVYGHASAGCLHIRPILNLKNIQGVEELRLIAARAVQLTIELGGSVSGEHGDGQARSEWLEQMFGSELVGAFRQLKQAADPQGLLNPGKIVNLDEAERLPVMDANLRFGAAYQAQAWHSILDFSSQGGLERAIEQCNGAGVCRKSEGVMCPSFQASGEEMHSTRGRSNLLRALISGHFPDLTSGERVIHEALDLCLACKGCKAECPSAVDVAKLKYAFSERYYQTHRHRLRDYLFGYIDQLAGYSYRLAPLANPFLNHRRFGGLRQHLLGMAHQRNLPGLSQRSLRELWAGQAKTADNLEVHSPPIQERVLLLSDAFSEYFQPETGLAACRALRAAGCQVELLPVIGSGRTLISKGFIGEARKQAQRVLSAIQEADGEGTMAVLGIEPSEILTLRDEYLDLFPGNEWAEGVARRAWMVDEYLVRPGVDGKTRIMRIDEVLRKPSGEATVLLHGHCYQKAQPPAVDGYPVGVEATASMLRGFGYSVDIVQAGCCGMAGAFGYEVEHYDLSQAVGELYLFPAVRQAASTVVVAASGFSCQAQIQDGVGREVRHPLSLLNI